MKKISVAPVLLSFTVLSLLASVALSDTLTNPQQNNDLATKAYNVLEKHCAKCHGKDKTGGFTFHDYKSMVDNGHIVPGKPDVSRIFVRASKSPSDPMPPRSQNDLLTEDEQKTLKVWIEAGAPQRKTDRPDVPHKFLTEADILHEIEDDLNRSSERDRPYLRYFTLTHLANAGASEDEVQAFRVGLSKLMNSLSWQKKITAPQSIDSGKTILRIDIRKFSWTEQTWKTLLAAYPYSVVSDTPTAKAIYAMTSCRLPYIRADWFVARAALPPLYHELLDLPDTAAKLEAKLGVDVEKDQKVETAIRAGLQESGVSHNNRVVERHESPYGAYWRSYDFRSNAGTENIFKYPLKFEAAGGEIIFNLPNGLQGYLLVNAKGERIDTGPIDIVSNKENVNDPVVRNGLTCMSCHVQGMKRFSDSIRAVVVATPNGQADYDRDHALALYVEKPKMDAALDEDVKRFADAVRETGAEVTTREPIYALQGRYDSTLDITQAAAEAGLPSEAFQSELQSNPRLGEFLGPLKPTGGRLKRDVWEEHFGDVAQEFHLGLYLKPLAAAKIDLEQGKAAEKRKDYASALLFYSKAAEAGEPQSMTHIGDIYHRGLGVAKNDIEAVKWYRNGAAAGDLVGMVRFGRMHADGIGVAKDVGEAIKWYRKAAEAGGPLGMVDLGYMYGTGDGVPKDYVEAIKWYRKAAEAGDTLGMYNMGSMYLGGFGVAKDVKEAVNWYLKAAEAGEPSGMAKLGGMYLNGIGVAEDYGEAVKWSSKAAEAGDPAGMAQLGGMYLNGWGVAKDYGEAVKWLSKAAEAGDPAGMADLGYMYLNGWDVVQDFNVSVKWSRKAAEAGIPAGMYNLGYMYEEGLGVTKDVDEAVKWYRKAARLGEDLARKALTRLGK